MGTIGGDESPGGNEAGSRGSVATGAHAPCFFNVVLDAALVLRADSPRFTVVAASDEYVRLTGRTRDELLGSHLFDVFPDNPADPNANGVQVLTETFDRVIRTRNRDSIALQRYDVAGRDGRFVEHWWSSSIGPVLDTAGAVAWIIVRLVDVTDLVQLKREGRASAALLEALRPPTSEVELEVVRRAGEVQETNQRLREAFEELNRLDEMNVAARARAEAAEAKLTTILESLTDGFLSVDRDWRFTYVNGRMEDLLARPRQALLGQNIWEVYPRAWDSPFGHAFRQAMETQEKVEVDGRVGAAELWFHVHAQPSPDGLTVYVHDITERHRAEESLRESEHRFRSVFDESMDASVLAHPEGSVVQANRACTELFGCDEEELRRVGREPFIDSVDPRLDAALAERRRTGRFRGEITLRRSSGETFPAEVSSALFRDLRGEEWASTFFRDISERKAQEAEREQLHARIDAEKRWLRAVLDNSPMGILLFEPDGRIYSNQYAEHLVGITVDSEKGNAQYQGRISLPDGAPISLDQLPSTRALRHGETIRAVDLLVQTADGTRVPILTSAAPIQDEQGHPAGAVVLFQDVSENMRAQEAIRASERLLSRQHVRAAPRRRLDCRRDRTGRATQPGGGADPGHVSCHGRGVQRVQELVGGDGRADDSGGVAVRTRVRKARDRHWQPHPHPGARRCLQDGPQFRNAIAR